VVPPVASEPLNPVQDDDISSVFDPLTPARSALRANAAAFWQREAPNDEQPVTAHHSVPPAGHVSDEGSPASTAESPDPAGAAVEALLSRSMDNFMRSFRGQHDTSRSGVSPQRLSRTAALFDDERSSRSQDASKRYMQMTESMALSQSLSPQRDRTEWVNAPLTQRPVWKLNTFRSPDRPRTSPGRPELPRQATSPGARTAVSLVDRLARQDRSVLFSRVVPVPQHGAVGAQALRSSREAACEQPAVVAASGAVEVGDASSTSDTSSRSSSVN
jgi:hypothetical protein